MFFTNIKYITLNIYRAFLIGFGATLTLTGLHKSNKVGVESAVVFLFPISASGIASAILISTLHASDHTWCEISTDVSNLILCPTCDSKKNIYIKNFTNHSKMHLVQIKSIKK